MSLDPKAERYELADAIQDAIPCEREEARKAAEAVQAVVSRHRGEQALPVDALTRYDELKAAVVAWIDAPTAERAKARAQMEYLVTGDFPLSPDDDDLPPSPAGDFSGFRLDQ